MEDTPEEVRACEPVLRFGLEACRNIFALYNLANTKAEEHREAYRRRVVKAGWMATAAVLLAMLTIAGELFVRQFGERAESEARSQIQVQTPSPPISPAPSPPSSAQPESQPVAGPQAPNAGAGKSGGQNPADSTTMAWVMFVFAIVETYCAVTAGVIAMRRTVSDVKDEWLTERHRAERCRLLKFRYLTNPLLWSGRKSERDRWKGELEADLHEIKSLGHAALESWITSEIPPRVWDQHVGAWPSPQARENLTEYYSRKRLGMQRDYFLDRANWHFERDRKTRPWPYWLFIGSVVFVIAHAFLDGVNFYSVLWSADKRAVSAVAHASSIFVYIAASLPAVGAAIRTRRTAHEYARNTKRFFSKYNALCEMDRRLAEVMNRPPAGAPDEPHDTMHDVDPVLRELGFCEYVLESDHREWLRLMAEAEWIG